MKKMLNVATFVKPTTWKTWNIIAFLLSFVIISLAISQYFHLNKEGFQEGLLTSTAITSVKKALDDYNDKIDSICAENVKNISKIQLSQTDSIMFSSILGDEALKNSAKIDKIVDLKSKNEDVKKQITEVNGQKYIATLAMLNTINKDTYPDDETFSSLLKQQTNLCQEIVNGPNSVYSQLKDYLKTIEIASQK